MSRGRYDSPYSEASQKRRFSSPYSTAHAEADPDLRRHYQEGGAVPERQFGGGTMGAENFMTHMAARNLHYEGLVNSAIPGMPRGSAPIDVLDGSYILPADVPSA